MLIKYKHLFLRKVCPSLKTIVEKQLSWGKAPEQKRHSSCWVMIVLWTKKQEIWWNGCLGWCKVLKPLSKMLTQIVRRNIAKRYLTKGGLFLTHFFIEYYSLVAHFIRSSLIYNINDLKRASPMCRRANEFARLKSIR